MGMTYDGTELLVVDAERRKVVAKLSAKVAMGGLNKFVVSDDGRTMLLRNDDFSISVIDLRAKRLKTKLEGHTGPVAGFLLTARGDKGVSWSVDDTTRFWDLKKGLELGRLPNRPGGLEPRFIDRGTRLVVADESGAVVYETASGKALRHVRTVLDTQAVVSVDGTRALDYDPDDLQGKSSALHFWKIGPVMYQGKLSISGRVMSMGLTPDGKIGVVELEGVATLIKEKLCDLAVMGRSL